MTAYEFDCINIINKGIYIIESILPEGLKGLCVDNKIGIHKPLTSIEKRCILAEEYCHYIYNVGDITNQGDISNRKQELYARKKAYEMLIPPKVIVESWNKGNRTASDMAEDLNVSESFLREAIEYYRVKQQIKEPKED